MPRPSPTPANHAARATAAVVSRRDGSSWFKSLPVVRWNQPGPDSINPSCSTRTASAPLAIRSVARLMDGFDVLTNTSGRPSFSLTTSAGDPSNSNTPTSPGTRSRSSGGPATTRGACVDFLRSGQCTIAGGTAFQNKDVGFVGKSGHDGRRILVCDPERNRSSLGFENHLEFVDPCTWHRSDFDQSGAQWRERADGGGCSS